jgi:hypothetical protein
MDTLVMDTQTLGILAIIVALIAVAGWLLYQKKQSRTLEQRFGPEYERTVEELGSRPKAEAELRTRQKRVEKLNIVALPPAEAARYAQAWRTLQGRFVDNPKGVLQEADELVQDLMRKRGYPMADFEGRAADISVDHPVVVEHYRAAQAIALRDQRGEADTEEMRRAVVHYRALFDDLLEVEEPAQQQREQDRNRKPMEARS